ncbi:PhzA/PhzB family protein [Streptomyces sp. NPDC090445]|uniref:PhzA/PhzB family protein n=1 Tax=Streptomyces sp. NPDC090445 TaxID=3365963 RepID=UPI003823AFEB
MPGTFPSAIPALADDTDLRRRNRETVKAYMKAQGHDQLRRPALFTEDGSEGLWTTDTGEPLIAHGRQRLARQAAWIVSRFPDWHWDNVRIFETQDPDHFWVECDGRGTILYPGYPDGYYEDHFIFSFLLDHGKIRQGRAFTNPYRQLRALGVAVPLIRRTGVPR